MWGRAGKGERPHAPTKPAESCRDGDAAKGSCNFQPAGDAADLNGSANQASSGTIPPGLPAAQLAAAPGRGPKRPLVPRVPAWKRPVDFALSLLLLWVLSPLWLLVALAVKLSSPGPVLYRQVRVGLLLRPFRMCKFRTMYVDADPEVHRRYVQQLLAAGIPMEKLDAEEDSRITWLGRYLRATSLDELPQLLNVLRGEMSLVGPRPCIPYETEKYKPWYFHRFECLPGMTGLWQVSGKNRLVTEQMMRLDIRYARSQRLWRDGWILLRTPGAVGREIVAAWRRWRQRRAARRALSSPAPGATKGIAPCSLSDSV